MNLPNLLLAAGIGVKILVLIGIAMYGIFAWVLVAQEARLGKLIEEQYESVLKIFVLLHLVATVGLFALAWILL